MIILSNFLITFGQLLMSVTGLYMLVVIASAVITWFPVPPWHPAVKILRGLTEPVYDRIRRFVPRPLRDSGIDISPIIVLLVLYFVNGVIFRSLVEIGKNM